MIQDLRTGSKKVDANDDQSIGCSAASRFDNVLGASMPIDTRPKVRETVFITRNNAMRQRLLRRVKLQSFERH